MSKIPTPPEPTLDQLIAVMHTDELQHYKSGRASAGWMEGIKARWTSLQESQTQEPPKKEPDILDALKRSLGDRVGRRTEPVDPEVRRHTEAEQKANESFREDTKKQIAHDAEFVKNDHTGTTIISRGPNSEFLASSKEPWHKRAEIVFGSMLALGGIAVAIGLVILPPTTPRAMIPWLMLMLCALV